METCCRKAVETRYRSWLEDVGAQDHPWMLDNLRLCLRNTVGSESVLESAKHLVRVAFIANPDDRFTWARQIIVQCPGCSQEVGLSILSSNAMFFLMRLLLTAALSVDDIREDGVKVVHQIRTDVTETQRSQLDAAMDVYRARRELTPHGLDRLLTEFRTTPVRAQAEAGKFHQASICWLLFHEIAHLVVDEAGPSPLTGVFLDHINISLTPARRSAWIGELSSDKLASFFLAGGIARHEAATLGSDANEVGRNVGLASGLVALTVFEIYEGYDVGHASLAETNDVGRDIAFATHPPIRLRKQFLRWCAETTGGPADELWQPTECALHELFADYVDRHPMPP